ncbi:4Fe-4S binding protein [Marinisporobacter balticus]|uniref:4Fe-4S binding protein n=1 Tax=Marinisporobacter balticus TaxID=2018667 RepID=A0A4R2KXK3_9FIRM|nr:4Fe-4S binding protein [Marinisporobacter balticus]TCO78663.1 4Fe-4S binding protein [Marinisporobacter balticus]
MKDRSIKNIRRLILAIFLIFISYRAYMHQVLGGGTEGSPSIHALCPYGGLESFYTLLSSGTFIQKIFSGTFVLFALTIILAIIFRRSFCGILCPFGALQEFLGMIGQKLFGKRFVMPKRIDQPMRYLKYIVLLITTIGAWVTAEMWMAPYDPWSAYGHIFGEVEETFVEAPIGIGLLMITIVGSILYDRFFCKYLCPMGAFLSIVSKVSPYKIERNEEKCIDCGICSKKCPVNIEVAKEKVITTAECINCQTCVLSCPKEGALEVKHGKKILTPLIVIIAVIGIYFGGVFAANIMGIYEVLPAPIPVGQIMDSEELKGYMALEEVSKYMDISMDELYTKLDLPKNIPHNTKLKEIKNYVEDFEVSVAREILKNR